MSNDYPQVRVLAGRHKRITGGHPWAFSNELEMTAEAKALPPGSLVVLASHSGEAIGVAGFNPHSLIAARLIDRKPKTAIDAAWLTARLRQCLELRDRLFDAPFYRLVHAEADGLPGLVVDRFGDVLSVQFNTALIERLREPVLEALESVLSPTAIVLRNDSAVRKLEGLDSAIEIVKGDLSAPVELTEYGVRFLADLTGGQKTGWFFDQRDNRRFMASLSRGVNVLDVYSHTGGFAIPAAMAGAESVTAVDKKDLKGGIRAYRKMMRLAARLTAPGGYLFVASCSHHMTAELFDEQMRKTLADANRSARVLRHASAAPDHPLHPFLPESGYLKALVLQLD
jgi:23S rRNA (cytosine1962-C5)-methyltransferase